MTKVNTQSNPLEGAIQSSSTIQKVNLDAPQAFYNALYATKSQDQQVAILNTSQNLPLLSQKTKSGYTILQLAAYHGRRDIIESLLKVPNIEIDETDAWGRTAFDLASHHGKNDAVRLLLEFKARSENLSADTIEAFVATKRDFKANELLKLTNPLISKIAKEDLLKLNPIVQKLLAKTHALIGNEATKATAFIKSLTEQLTKVIDGSLAIKTILKHASEANGSIFIGDITSVELPGGGCFNPTNNNIYLDNSNVDIDRLAISIVHESTHQAINNLFNNGCLPYAQGETYKFASIENAMEEELNNDRTNFLASSSKLVGKSWLQWMTKIYKTSEIHIEIFAWLTMQAAYNIIYRKEDGSLIHPERNTSPDFSKIVWNHLQENIIKPLNRDTSQALETMPQDLGFIPIPEDLAEVIKRANELIKEEFTIACFEEGEPGKLAFKLLSEKVQENFIDRLFSLLDKNSVALLAKHADNILNGLANNGTYLFFNKLFTLEDSVLVSIFETNTAIFKYLPVEALQLLIDKVFALKPASLIAFLEEKSVALFKISYDNDNYSFINKLFKLPAEVLQSILSKNENIVELIKISPHLVYSRFHHLDKNILKSLLTSYTEEIKTAIKESDLASGEDSEYEDDDSESQDFTQKDFLRMIDVLVYQTLGSSLEQEGVSSTNYDEIPAQVDCLGEVDIVGLHAIL
jgi:hypothetical protein